MDHVRPLLRRCVNGAMAPDMTWTAGEEYNFPEINCCGCGGGSTYDPDNAPCTDTEFWDNNFNVDCAGYVAQSWSVEGACSERGLDSNLPSMLDAFALRLMRPVRTIEHRVTLTLQYQNTVEYVGNTQFGFR